MVGSGQKRGSNQMEWKRDLYIKVFWKISGEEVKMKHLMLEELYQAASCEKEKLAVPGAAHAESAAVAPELYWPAVDAFLARHMA